MQTLKMLFGTTLILAAACTSTRVDSGLGNSTVAIPPPEVKLTQISQVASVARGITGGVPVQYRLQITNHAKEAITLLRVDLQSLGSGAYTLNPVSRPYDVKIAPDGFRVVELWAPATIDTATVYGANGPVTLRCITQYDSPMGHFQNLVVGQVHDNMLETQ